MREICESASVVRVTMRHEDVPNIAGRESQFFDPTDRCVMFVELKSGHVDQRLAQAFDWILNVK